MERVSTNSLSDCYHFANYQIPVRETDLLLHAHDFPLCHSIILTDMKFVIVLQPNSFQNFGIAFQMK